MNPTQEREQDIANARTQARTKVQAHIHRVRNLDAVEVKFERLNDG